MLRTLALTLLVATATAFSVGPTTGRMPAASRAVAARPVVMGDNIRELRTRIGSIKNTKKITQAMKLVAAAKVRRAQDAVLRSRPFSENLEAVLGGLIARLKNEPLDFPLLQERETNTVLLVVVSGERGLCGGYNAQIIKKATQRLAELKAQGVKVRLLTVGRKANVWFKRREIDIVKFYPCPQAPTSEFASEIADEVLNYFLSGEVDRVELLYTSFVSMIASLPSVRTLVPLSPQGLETDGDEIFKLTTKDGKFGVEREAVPRAEPMVFKPDMLFEQEPAQLLNAILPLYINGQLLRTVQVRPPEACGSLAVAERRRAALSRPGPPPHWLKRFPSAPDSRAVAVLHPPPRRSRSRPSLPLA
jgi:F-type H+-transporting ATPase subunit gamma